MLNGTVYRVSVQDDNHAALGSLCLMELPSLARGFLLVVQHSCLSSSHHTAVPASRKEGEPMAHSLLKKTLP